ncbi:MAG TPA: ParB/RepB/Spo0J family partition protein [Gemmatimonadales bacterium]|nr:ParB/RepB/Spo0J family partition protein [Gemmatimonadales bacterium]
MKTTIRTSATMPIRQLRNVNLTWVRRDLGDLTDLCDSIDKDGLQLPVLLTPTLQVADGARRLVACEMLGWTQIPVLRTVDWDEVTSYYEQVAQLNEKYPHLPMDWRSTTELYRGPLKELFAERLIELRREVLDQNAKAKRQGKKLDRPSRRDFYLMAAVKTLGLRLTDFRAIREAYSILDKLEEPAARDEDPQAVKQRHEWAAILGDQLLESEADGGNRLTAVLARLRMARRGEDPTTVREARGRRIGVADDSSFQARRAAARGKPMPPSGREIDAATIASIAQVVTHIADMAHGYGRVRPDAPVDVVAKAVDEIKTATSRLNALNKILRAFSTNPNLEERS